MKIISIVAQKGGVGKTTLALNFAVKAEGEGKRVAVLDMDAQQSTSTWSAKYRNAEGPVFAPSQAHNLASQLEILRNEKLDYVFIDTPPQAPQMSDILTSAIEVSNLVIIPFTPEIFAVEATAKTAEAIHKAKKPALIVINKAPLPHHIKAIEDVLATAKTYGLPICPHMLAKRGDYEKAERNGLGVVEYDPQSTASHELEAVYKEVIKQAEEQ